MKTTTVSTILGPETIPDTDEAHAQLAEQEVDLRHRLAVLGYGPIEVSKLTHSEIRGLLEGSFRAEEREWKKQVRLRGGDPDKAEAKQQANDEMESEMQAQIDAIKESR